MAKDKDTTVPTADTPETSSAAPAPLAPVPAPKAKRPRRAVIQHPKFCPSYLNGGTRDHWEAKVHGESGVITVSGITYKQCQRELLKAARGEQHGSEE